MIIIIPQFFNSSHFRSFHEVLAKEHYYQGFWREHLLVVACQAMNQDRHDTRCDEVIDWRVAVTG